MTTYHAATRHAAAATQAATPRRTKTNTGARNKHRERRRRTDGVQVEAVRVVARHVLEEGVAVLGGAVARANDLARPRVAVHAINTAVRVIIRVIHDIRGP